MRTLRLRRRPRSEPDGEPVVIKEVPVLGPVEEDGVVCGSWLEHFRQAATVLGASWGLGDRTFLGDHGSEMEQ